MELPETWSHESGSRLNGDGAAKKYSHDSRPLVAYVEATVNESDEENPYMEYFTVIFNVEGGRPWARVEPHEFFRDQDAAEADLEAKLQAHR